MGQGKLEIYGFLLLFLCEIGYMIDINELVKLQEDCREGTFGYKCQFKCKCKRFPACNKVTGECIYGCDDGTWGPGCQLSNNCFYNGNAMSYMGTKTVTDSLHSCQRWDSQTPHRHSYTSESFPDNLMPENYCRSTEDSARPWCYTTDDDPRWEHCNVNNCNCPAKRFGKNCEKECHCKDSDESCDSIVGICNSGCAPGWDGYDCQQPVACPINHFGWDCSKRCYCKNSRHCNRFTGPTKNCECQDGYFNPPHCQPVTPPKITYFGSVKVNPGQNTTLNCTATAYPLPAMSEIRVWGPQRRRVTIISSGELEVYMYTRYNIYSVESVNAGDTFTCSVNSVAGSTTRSFVAEVFELPRLANPPVLVEEETTSTEISIEWERWSRDRGDMGEPPILWYTVMYEEVGQENTAKLAEIVLEMNCQMLQKCNATIRKLEPNTEYEITISTRRNGEGGDGPPSPPLRVRTLCKAPKQPPIIDQLSSGFEYNTSVPETQLIVMWRDPPKSSWNCDNISTYQIFYQAQKPGSRPNPAIHVPGDAIANDQNLKSATISDLEPATEYCVSMTLQNSRSLYSPESPTTCTVTPNTTPTAPRKVQLEGKTSNSITLSWEKPLLPPRELRNYRVLYWKDGSNEEKGIINVRSEEDVIEATVSGLEPFTTYLFEVRGINRAGPGDISPVFVVKTMEGSPTIVREFHNTSRTQNSISFTWQEPTRSNGEILFYTLTCRPEEGSKAATAEVRQTRVHASTLKHTFRQLTPATLYSCNINASTGHGTGPNDIIKVWTKPQDPKDPPSPRIVQSTPTTITIEMKSIDNHAVDYVRIIVENTKEGRIVRREVPEGVRDVEANYQQAHAQGLRAYIAAQLPTGQAEGVFVVGDNKTYNGYWNAPLAPNQEYNLWFGVYSNVDGTSQKSFSKAEKHTQEMSVGPAPENRHISVIIVVLVVFVILILVFVLLLFLWRKRHIAAEREKAEMPNFGPTIIPEPDTSTPSTPVDDVEAEPLIERSNSSSIVIKTENIFTSIGSNAIPPVKVEDLWDYVKQNKEKEAEGFRKEYKIIPADLTASCEAAKKAENKNKNRYGNIIAYDHSRVILQPIDLDICDDYTNANYIDGYKKNKAYIAAQGPTKPTMNDIWRMAWQEQSKTIVMLTNPTEAGKKKCEQYWPDEGKEIYGEIMVTLVETETLPDFTIRTFHITKGNESTEIRQYHYTTWPDHGVPRFGNSLLLLRQKIRSHDPLDSGPPIVHCSAGVGRTGTYIAVDANLEQAKNEGIVDVHNFVRMMRTQRVNMVQTLEQYIFVYDVLLEALICGDTTIPTELFPENFTDLIQFDQNIGKTKLEEQFEVMRLVTNSIERDETTNALRPENIFKNRCKSIVPANRCRPYLMTPVEDYNDYINAIFLNSYRKRDAYIITQMPLPNTVVDFWRLIYDHNSYCIVMLNEIDPNDIMIEQYWTLDTCGEQYGPFIVETTAEIKSDPMVTVRDFTITNTLNAHEVPRIVRQFHFHRWSEQSSVPHSKVALLELLDQVDRWQKQSGGRPVTVHCTDGALRSGLFVAASCIIERMRTDKEVDVFQAVKQIRLNRSQVIDCIEQYRFLHEVALEYYNLMKQLTTFS